MGCIELVAQPLRSFAGGLGRDNGALAGPELGSERLGAHGSGQGQRPGRWRAPRDQGAGEEIERPQRRGRPRLLEGDRPGGQGEQLVAALGGREMRRGGRGPMQAIERGEGPVVRAIVGGRLGEPRRFRYGERGGIAALALRGALAAMEMRCGADLDGRVGERRPGRQRELGEQRVGDQRGRGCDMGGGVGHGLEAGKPCGKPAVRAGKAATRERFDEEQAGERGAELMRNLRGHMR